MTAMHVMPRLGRWSVVRAGACRTSRVFPTSAEAWEHAKKKAAAAGAIAYRHDETGRIVERRA